MIYVITDAGVTAGKSIKEVNKKLDILLENVEFRHIGSDKIVNLTNTDLEFVMDKKLMSKIPMKNLYRKKDNTGLMLLGMLILQFIILVKG